MRNDDLKINIQIDGVRMPLNIVRKDEQIYRDAERLVKVYLDEYQKKYSQKSYSEILIYVAFRLAVALKKQQSIEDVSPLVEKIVELDQELAEILNAKE